MTRVLSLVCFAFALVLHPPEPGAQIVSPTSAAAALADAKRAGFDLLVEKRVRRLHVRSPAGGTTILSFAVGLGFDPTGDKVRSGDGRTPEGAFVVTRTLPQSQFYKAFLLSYPEIRDADRGERTGLIDAATASRIRDAHRRHAPPPHDTALGGLIEIHGRGAASDWTLGCVALDDDVIDLLWPVVGVGTKVEIRP